MWQSRGGYATSNSSTFSINQQKIIREGHFLDIVHSRMEQASITCGSGCITGLGYYGEDPRIETWTYHWHNLKFVHNFNLKSDDVDDAD